jgi:ribosomal protein S18 acetylase RimI-like enzyme
MELYFQRASEEDAAAIKELYQEAIGSKGCTWSADYPTEEITRGDLARGDLFCFKTKDGEVVGAVSVDDDAQVEALPCWSKEFAPGAELARLVVKEAYQNQGIARRLLLGGMQELKRRGCRSVHFLVSRHNERALRSYAVLDFTVRGESDLYGESWLCYEKHL